MTVAAWASVAAVLAQAPGPEFPSQVELVTLDVIVVDAKGQPVRDLTRDDFVVKEDGAVQEVVSFERFGSADDLLVEAPSPGSTAGPAVRPPHAGAVVAVIVDDQGLSLRESTDTRDALARFVTVALGDGDSITLATTSGDAWWTTTMAHGRQDVLAIVERLRGKATDASLALDHLSDYEAFAIRDRDDAAMVARVVRRWTSTGACVTVPMGMQDPGCPGRVRATAAAVDGDRRNRTRSLLATLRRTLDGLALRRGRKSVLLFSRGFLQDSDTTARDVAAAARAANAAVYFVDARGLQVQPGQYSAADPGTPNPSDFGRSGFEAGVLESSGAQALADETGGTSFRNASDLGGAAARIAGESREYYLVGFHPRSDKSATAWRKLSVDVSRPGVTVRTRKGYTLRAATGERGRADMPAGEPSAAMAGVLDSAHDVAGIPVRARAFAFEPRPKRLTRVVVAVEFDARPLSFEGRGPRAARLALGVAVTHRDSGRTLESHEQVEVRLREGDLPGWRSLAREFEVPAGVSQARVVLRETRAGAMGATAHRFEVPSTEGLRLTTPILTDRVEPGGGDHPRAAIAIERVFRPRGPVYCEFEVLGAVSDRERRAPRVTAGIEVRAADGRIVRKGDPTPIAPDSRGRLLRLVGIGLDGLADGDYEVVLDVRDEVAGRSVRRPEPFTLRSLPD